MILTESQSFPEIVQKLEDHDNVRERLPRELKTGYSFDFWQWSVICKRRIRLLEDAQT